MRERQRDGRCPTTSGKSAATRPDKVVIDVYRSGNLTSERHDFLFGFACARIFPRKEVG
mgnify:CR=1 FL=1